jgi:hypothetical protein
MGMREGSGVERTESMASRTRGEVMIPARKRLCTNSLLDEPLDDHAIMEKKRFLKGAVVGGKRL